MVDEKTRASKFLALVLRHDPSAAAVAMDGCGWVSTDDLIKGMNAKGYKINDSDLESIVDYDTKQRYSFNTDGTKIRANQGHSVQVDLGLQPVQPPKELYHGTATRFLDSIWEKGLLPQSRQQVHLSSDSKTAVTVGSRHGKPVVLTINTEQMYSDGVKFYQSENGVWLTDAVPAKYFKDQTNG